MPDQDDRPQESSEVPDRSSRWSAGRANRGDRPLRDPEARGATSGDRRSATSGGADGRGGPSARAHNATRGTGRMGAGGLGRGASRGDNEPDRPDRRDRGPRSWELNSPNRPTDRPRIREPELPDDVTGKELDRSVWTELRTLSKENAQGVARHLVAAAQALSDDEDLALEHAEHAAKRAGRVAAVREALGFVRYRRGEFSDALREFRTARRLSGSNHLIALMVDCERGLGRPDRALELANSAEAKDLSESDNIELAIVVSGVRRDLGQADAAVMSLRIPALEQATDQPWAARLFYAYADSLVAAGDEQDAQVWFGRALDADVDGETDAAERLGIVDELEVTDLLEGQGPDDEDEDDVVPDGPSRGA